jgi:predicted aspartyl protease
MTERFDYDLSKDPPAPMLPLLVGRPGVRPAISVVALVDSGADATVIPQSVARRLRLPVIGTIRVRGVGGASRQAPLYSAVIQVAGTSEPVEVLALGDEILVGRDLLNRWTVALRGPERRLEVDARTS